MSGMFSCLSWLTCVTQKNPAMLFSDMAKQTNTHTRTHTFTHTRRQKHTQTTYPLEKRHRPLGSLPFSQKPLGKVAQSDTNTFSQVSEEVLRFEKWPRQSLHRSTTLDGGAAEHEVGTTNRPTGGFPKVAYSLPVRGASGPFNMDESQSCSPDALGDSLNREQLKMSSSNESLRHVSLISMCCLLFTSCSKRVRVKEKGARAISTNVF